MSARPPLRVLLVEDHLGTRELLTELLTAEGFQVIVALGGVDALRSVGAARPDVVLLDLGLPQIGGDAFVRVWRERDQRAHEVPVIVISGRDDAARIAADIGAAGFFPKPFDGAAVVAGVSRLARRRTAEASSPGAGAPTGPVRVGELETRSGRVRVLVDAEHEPPFALEVSPPHGSPVRVTLDARQLEVLLTLLDMAGRQPR
ncbi:MAG TPA: response regulator [Candidatus Limnocylindria bacterium]|nr:response regulator [Candidatus Limnocylindria bacterium]